MTRVRNILSLNAAILIILSSTAHSLLGWKALGAQLTAAGAPADLIGGLRIGWQFGGAAMLTFGFAAPSSAVVFVSTGVPQAIADGSSDIPSIPGVTMATVNVGLGGTITDLNVIINELLHRQKAMA